MFKMYPYLKYRKYIENCEQYNKYIENCEEYSNNLQNELFAILGLGKNKYWIT